MTDTFFPGLIPILVDQGDHKDKEITIISSLLINMALHHNTNLDNVASLKSVLIRTEA